ncbi:MAG: response regulator [Rariglobus sp.]
MRLSPTGDFTPETGLKLVFAERFHYQCACYPKMNYPPVHHSSKGQPRAEAEAMPTLNIVHLEDDLNDREFVRRALQKAGLRCEFSYAETEAEFDSALSKGNRNLILSDFTLPGYSGSDALAFARKHYPDIPYIFVSGTIGEERAVESLKGGATDYVLKNNLARLPAAVEYATRVSQESARRRQAESALRESEHRFREMAENIRDVFWISSSNGRELLYVSPGFMQIWGLAVAELHAHPERWIKSILEEDRDRVVGALATLAEGGEVRIEYRIRRPDGSVRWIETRAYPSSDGKGDAHAVGVSADITERKHLQEQLLQSQKMEAIGQLAGGVAHDFNNLLTVINGYSSLTLSSGALPESLKKPLQQIQAAGDRAANLTRQLLVFSRKQTMQLKPIDLNQTIDESVRMLSRLIDERVELEVTLAPKLPRIRADAGMIEQVLMNLVVNARDAMPEGGRLRIATRMRIISAEEAKREPSKRAGSFVWLSVSDTGEGIPGDVLPKIFDPFFTTKEVGKGTGLGLSMVFGIVDTHGGWLTTTSKVGEGTTFDIFLPAIASAETISPSAADPDAGRGTETILLVEDEAAVRDLTRTVLQNYGYTVHTACNSEEAFEVWREHRGKIKLLLTDLIMPDAMTGVELARLLRGADPELKVICVSGYGREMADQKSPLTSDIAFMQKPCAPRALAHLVRDTLDGKKAATPGMIG